VLNKLDSVLLSGIELKCQVPFWCCHFKGCISLCCNGSCMSPPSVSVSVPGSLFIWPLCFQNKFVRHKRNFCGQSEPRTLLTLWNLKGVFLLHHCMQVVPIRRPQLTLYICVSLLCWTFLVSLVEHCAVTVTAAMASGSGAI
jgi:hypothetical protein